MKKLLLATTIFMAMASSAMAVMPTFVSSGLGNILADENGMTLYIFTKDTDGVSNCYGGCAVKWPPLFAEADDDVSGDFSLIERKDGKLQWAHNGMPLYLWINDKAVGDTTGHEVGGVWYVISE
ncbi:MAG: hypothetical protein HRU29_11830 [Rhizobiales bacterium]|nr:hypothetical protein [Hyphomicrobiales bacterium]NRB15079.1 hypothetical protein [Hyphomicrobiales bacterium]